MAAQRILVIEDEPGARLALESLLTEDGYAVCSAETGEAGLARLAEFCPDTVICDFYLPGIDGLEVLRHVRESLDQGVVFIALTAGCGGEETESTLRREADFFFQKPLDLRRFRRALQLPALRRRNPTVAASPVLNQKEASNGRI